MDANTLREIRRDLSFWVSSYGIDAVREALAYFEERERLESAPAVRSVLLADLGEWPQVFQKRLRAHIEEEAGNPAGARQLLEYCERSREAGTTETPSSCGCGCNGRNSGLGRHLVRIREAAEEVRVHASSSALVRSRRREYLEHAKVLLLWWLWLTGQRSIDRLQLGQHAVEAAKAEAEDCEREITRRRKCKIKTAEKRLALRIYQKGPKKGQPIPEHLLCETERTLASARAEVRHYQARITELYRLVSENVPELVRQYTGCSRKAADAD